MAFAKPVAVICATYSGRSSRLLYWNTETDEVQEGQWVKARVYPLDVSPDGETFAYFAESFHRKIPSYLAVSRPPYLTALAFWPAFHLHRHDAYFSEDGTRFEWGGRPLALDYTLLGENYCEPRFTEGCPYALTTWNANGDEATLAGLDALSDKWQQRESRRRRDFEAAKQQWHQTEKASGWSTFSKDSARWNGGFNQDTEWRTWDHRGRKVVCKDWQVSPSRSKSQKVVSSST